MVSILFARCLFGRRRRRAVVGLRAVVVGWVCVVWSSRSGGNVCVKLVREVRCQSMWSFGSIFFLFLYD